VSQARGRPAGLAARPPGNNYLVTAPSEHASLVGVTYIGHATVLIELDGLRLLTDPWLRPRLGPLVRFASLAPPTRQTHDALDAVLISHTHVDHLDPPSLRRIARDTRVIVSPGCGPALLRLKFSCIEELLPGETTTVGTLRVTATPARHASARTPLHSIVPSLGFICSGSASVYFAGDTALFEGMRDLASDLDVALIPVTGIGPRLPEGEHLGPLTAARALTLLRPKVAIPIHWGTMGVPGNRRLQALSENAGRLFAAHAAELAPDVRVIVLAPGEGTVVRV
jgi:L-ascorbate metabolism protein UlaG (beta-lactamase superfamily)